MFVILQPSEIIKAIKQNIWKMSEFISLVHMYLPT
jgi:hypothetical protein